MGLPDMEVAMMNYETKAALARTNDMSLEACTIRLRAARALTGLAAKDLAAACGMSKQALSSAENAVSFPSRELMRYLYREHRIDFNFMINGDFVQLPGDVQDALFPALERANSEWGRKSRSGRSVNP